MEKTSIQLFMEADKYAVHVAELETRHTPWEAMNDAMDWLEYLYFKADETLSEELLWNIEDRD